MLFSKACICALLLIATTTPTVAGTPTEDFNNDAIVRKAVSDIGEMNRDELERFIDYLSSCDSTQSKEAFDLNCAKARNSYTLRYERGRSIDRMILLITVFKDGIEMKDKSAKPNTPEKDEVNKWLFRYIEILEQFRDAARKAYLRRTK